MSTITGSAGAGGATAPQSYTIKQLVDIYGVTGATSADVLKHFVERDKAVLSETSAVYLIAIQSASQTFKVLLKATGDAEGVNPLQAVKTFTTPVSKTSQK